MSTRLTRSAIGACPFHSDCHRRHRRHRGSRLCYTARAWGSNPSSPRHDEAASSQSCRNILLYVGMPHARSLYQCVLVSTRYISKFNSVLTGNPDSQRLDSNLAKSVLIAREICPDRVGGIASAVFGLRPNPAPPQSFLPPQPPAASHECRLLLPTARQPPQSEAERAYAMAHARHTQPRHAVASLRQQRET